VTTTLLAVQTWSHSRWAARPTDLERPPVLSYRVDLNQAERAELLQLPGVGPSLAGRIQDYRHEHGGFRSVDGLVGVRGIGPVTLERLKPWVRVQDAGATDRSPVPAQSAPATASSTREGKKTGNLTEPIDINRATQEDLQRLPGIGPKISQRILDERQKGAFKSVDDLRRVSGIGPKIMERLRPYICVNLESARVPTSD
jgi:competence protein ComEA